MSDNAELLTFEISQDILAALKVSTAQLEQRMRLLAAIAYFQEKTLSLGKAAELAGMNRLFFIDRLAAEHSVVFDYDASVLANELKAIDRLRAEEPEGHH